MKQQYSFLGKEFEVQNEFGGEHSIGKRKSRRPVSTKDSMHITLRSEFARGRNTFFHHKNFIHSLIFRMGKKWGVKVYEYSINSNHLHILVRARSRRGFQNFLRAVSGLLARQVTKAQKGKAFGKRFFDLIAFSRIVKWGRDFKRARNYVVKNQLEADGHISFVPRSTKLFRVHRSELLAT